VPSPFPGMDPYLEHADLWPAFHKLFVSGLYQLLLPGLVDKYRARLAARDYTTELPLFTSILRENHTEEYLEIRSRADGRLVTLVDVVGLRNRTTAAGRAAYLATRSGAEQSRAACVEIDLLQEGAPMLSYDRSELPPVDQTITLTRANMPGKYEIYTAQFAKRLPKIRVPLAPEDRDASVELQDVFRRAYEGGNFASRIDYSQLPPAPAWASESAKQAVKDYTKAVVS
jgi:hypothetical protein